MPTNKRKTSSVAMVLVLLKLLISNHHSYILQAGKSATIRSHKVVRTAEEVNMRSNKRKKLLPDVSKVYKFD